MKKRILGLSFLLFTFIGLQAQVTVSGNVKAASDEEVLIGAQIVEKGTANGMVADLDGNYKIEVSSEDAILVFSYLGYETKEVVVGSQRIINVSLGTDSESLDEVIVIGYGTQKKSVVTGSISKVDGESLEDMPVMRIEQSLQGRTSGVRVVSGSGQPGDGATVRIRGTSSIGSGSDPLYVVDGIPIGGGIDFLNQSDIESIEVLKDAASASIYGARSAAGVVLVTTKKGKKDRMEVSYSAYRGTQAPWKKMSLLNATEYATLMNESSEAAGNAPIFEDPNSLGEGTDWQDAIFSNNAPIQNHEISLSSGSEKSQYYASFGYFDQEGIVAQDNSNYRRFTARFNSTHKINDRLTFGNTISYARINAEGVATNSEFGSPLSRAVNIDPITPLLETDPDVLSSSVFTDFPIVKNEDGIPYGISTLVTSEVVNPVAAIQTQYGYGWSDKVVGNAYGEVKIIDGLKFRSSIGTDLAFWGGEGFTPIHYLNATTGSTITEYTRNQNRGLYWIFENTLSYAKTMGKHDFSALIGTMAEKNQGQGNGGKIEGIPVDNLEDASFGFFTSPESQTYGGYEYLSTLNSYLSRVNYNYASKYLFTATMRADGSSKFGSNNKFGFFPSASVGWVLTEESFLTQNPIINFLKIRGSWGVNGNDQIDDFKFISTVGGGRNYTFGLDDQLVNGVSPNAIANPDLRWEQTSQTNFGLDARVFKKIEIAFDIFEKQTTGMLLDIQVPGFVGNTGPLGNIATMVNRGVELEVSYRNSFGQFNTDFSGNGSFVENEVIYLGPEKEFVPGQRFGPQGLEITRTTLGQPIGHFYGYQTDGIFQNEAEVEAYVSSEGQPIQPNAQPGDFKFVDLNGNGEIDDEDRTIIGDPTPSLTYGFNASVDWKGFELSVFGQGIAGNDVYRASRRFDLGMANLTTDALGRWTGEGSTNDYPRLVEDDPNKNFNRSSDFYVEDGSFFRIKTLQLGYSLPEAWVQKIRLQKLKVYVSGNNLVTITNYSGFDPEIGGNSYGVDRGIYPQARFFLAGVNASF